MNRCDLEAFLLSGWSICALLRLFFISGRVPLVDRRTCTELYGNFHTVGDEFREYEGKWNKVRLQSGSQQVYFIQIYKSQITLPRVFTKQMVFHFPFVSNSIPK
jgi:hypothetical protein